ARHEAGLPALLALEALELLLESKELTPRGVGSRARFVELVADVVEFGHATFLRFAFSSARQHLAAVHTHEHGHLIKDVRELGRVRVGAPAEVPIVAV